jgi:hypothetical protein
MSEAFIRAHVYVTNDQGQCITLAGQMFVFDDKMEQLTLVGDIEASELAKHELSNASPLFAQHAARFAKPHDASRPPTVVLDNTFFEIEIGGLCFVLTGFSLLLLFVCCFVCCWVLKSNFCQDEEPLYH